MSAELLPDNATPLQRALADRWSDLARIDTAVVDAIWDAWRCPAALLPWLAEALSVDLWDDAWPEPRKRAAIADSPRWHRIKGSRLSVEEVLALLGRSTSLVEWYQRVPRGRRGTFTVHVEATPDEALAVAGEARRLVDLAKPKSRSAYVGAGERVPGTLATAAALLSLDVLDIRPFAFVTEDAAGTMQAGGGLNLSDLQTIGAA